jgi:ATP-dependent helicase/DNAse subunit B
MEQHVMDAFREEYFSDHPKDEPLYLTGKNLLIKDIILQYIGQLLVADQKFAPFRPLSLEQTYKGSFSFYANGQEKQVTLKGTIDRVDETREGIRIVDYKTGNSRGRVKDIPSLFTGKGQHDALQALLYGWLYRRNHETGKTLIPGLYYFRNIYNNDFDYRLLTRKNGTITLAAVKDELEENLQSTLQELFNPEVPFARTDDKDACRYCPYASICRREQLQRG